jgi:hypothetical protein
MTMHKTTRALLEFLRHTTTAFPKETPQYHDWREAGYPDLDEPEPELEPGTCLTCKHDAGPYCIPENERLDIHEWAQYACNIGGRVRDDYRGPRCPGWEPRP